MKVVEEYCWAVTQASGLSCCELSGSSVMECGFEPDSLVYTYVVNHMCSQFRLARNSTSVGPCRTSLQFQSRSVCSQWRTQEFCSERVQQIQLRTEDRENGDLGAVAP